MLIWWFPENFFDFLWINFYYNTIFYKKTSKKQQFKLQPRERRRRRGRRKRQSNEVLKVGVRVMSNWHLKQQSRLEKREAISLETRNRQEREGGFGGGNFGIRQQTAWLVSGERGEQLLGRPLFPHSSVSFIIPDQAAIIIIINISQIPFSLSAYFHPLVCLVGLWRLWSSLAAGIFGLCNSWFSPPF